MENMQLSFKQALKKIRDTYVIRQVQRLTLPPFSSQTIRRYQIVFSGRVQKVGFRLAVCELAGRLGLTGWCRNLENGDVLAELQGPDEKIQYLISFMESLKRIKIRRKVVTELDLRPEETGFTRL